MKTQTTNMIKLKLIRNKAVLKIKNKTHETVTFGKTNMMGIVDLRFSLRDEIGLCPNIEVEIDVTDKSPHFHQTFSCQ